jgi:hypothetical protein
MLRVTTSKPVPIYMYIGGCAEEGGQVVVRGHSTVLLPVVCACCCLPPGFRSPRELLVANSHSIELVAPRLKLRVASKIGRIVFRELSIALGILSARRGAVCSWSAINIAARHTCDFAGGQGEACRGQGADEISSKAYDRRGNGDCQVAAGGFVSIALRYD